MFDASKVADEKDKFLEQAKVARSEREFERKREKAAGVIQRIYRGYRVRQSLRKRYIDQVDEFFRMLPTPEGDKSALGLFAIAKRLIWLMRPRRLRSQLEDRFEHLIRHCVDTMENDTYPEPYVACMLRHDVAVAWIQQVKQLLVMCSDFLKHLKPEYAQDVKPLTVYLHMLVTFTSHNSWSILKSKSNEPHRPVFATLCQSLLNHLVSRGLYANVQCLLIRGLVRTKPALKRASLMAATNLAIRPLVSAQFNDETMHLFLLHFLSVPGLVFHLDTMAPECLGILETHCILKRVLDLFVAEQSLRIVFNALEASHALCLFANMVQLAHLQLTKALVLDFVLVATKLLEFCQCYVVKKQASTTHWHPILGWFAQTMDSSLHEAISTVKIQLQLLWSPHMVSILFQSLVDLVPSIEANDVPFSPSSTNSFKSRSGIQQEIARLSEYIKGSGNRGGRGDGMDLQKGVEQGCRLGSAETTLVSLTCQLYETAIQSLSQMKLDILTGLSCQANAGMLVRLWRLISAPQNGVKAFVELLVQMTKPITPEFQILILFCDCAAHLITIVDDEELYEAQKPFTLSDLCAISSFVNYLCFRLIHNQLIDLKSISQCPLFCSAHTLLLLLYRRDCRRSFADPQHWLIKDAKVSAILSDLEKNRGGAHVLLQRLPHIVPHKERVLLFRRLVKEEKNALGPDDSVPSTQITVHRARIVEDGYQQLAQLPTSALKGIIRVKFINAQGLDEAGIDQDGVFKEFLEETIKRVFDPALNLFKATSDNRLYPSPTSSIHENHLSLFEFVGKMLGKAVYEGIVVDVPFAHFFLSQLLGHQSSGSLHYSCLDELPSLDQQFYKSLTYIKRYEGDVQELALTFSLDDESLGRIETHELIPGGRAISVVNENKISYVHLMARYKMHTQIQEQSRAFVRGFKSIVQSDWLNMFSVPELQRLISGDNAPVDLRDLRNHTQYIGGFHNNHRVITWLWDILKNDFTPEEHRMFLKFVTSCSKPPLLGFAHLHPPFSIRCVEVSDDQDTGDTVGSFARTFFRIRKKDPITRLPTSSTCFNLLKLPNYRRKETLREKLRYAISSNTGFELS